MILSSQTSEQDAEQMLHFYLQHFDVVELVTCSKCGTMLAFECSGGSDNMGMQPNELGKFVIPIGNHLRSHRVRLDEAPTGERMIGYQCGAPIPNPLYPAAKRAYDEEIAKYEAEYKKQVAKAKKAKQPEPPIYTPPILSVPEFIPCGNDTRIADVERGLVPVGAMQTSLSPFEKHKIRESIRENRSHKADFKKVGNIKHFETFQVERITR